MIFQFKEFRRKFDLELVSIQNHIIDVNAPRRFSMNMLWLLNSWYSRYSWFSVASTQRRWTRTGTAVTSVAGSATNPWQASATFLETSILTALSATKAFSPMAARNAAKSSELTPRYHPKKFIICSDMILH